MELVKPTAQWQLHPQFEGTNSRGHKQSEGSESLRAQGKAEQIKCLRMAASKAKELLDKDNSICWTVCTNTKLIWIESRAYLGQHNQTLIPIFSTTYRPLNNSSK